MRALDRARTARHHLARLTRASSSSYASSSSSYETNHDNQRRHRQRGTDRSSAARATPTTREPTIPSSGDRRNAHSFASDESAAERWADLASRGVDVNPCNSPAHPAATLGVDAAAYVSARPRRSLQQAYDPQCIDFVSGVATPDTHGKIGLETFRCDDEEHALESRAKFPRQYEEFPGVVAPAMLGAVASAHGNWAASIALMDRAILPRPPLMTMRALEVRVEESVSPGEPLTLRSRVVAVADAREPFEATVDVTVKSGHTSRVVATATCSYEKIGAVRSMR